MTRVLTVHERLEPPVCPPWRVPDMDGAAILSPERRPGIRHVAVFRALNLGDLLCSVPALRALRHALPHAYITLIGLPSVVPLLERFPDYIDELVEFPGNPSFPEQTVKFERLPGFYRGMRARRFDLALQMHGSGRCSNELVQALEPACWAGFVPGQDRSENGRLMPWPDHLHEVHRYLALLNYLGIDANDDTLEFPISTQDSEHADAIMRQHGLMHDRLIFIHPGARLASRRWPVERYRHVAIALIDRGWQPVITGSDDEQELCAALARRCGPVCVNLCGQTPLGVLAALFLRGQLLICNDTGVSHVAASVGARSVVIACGSDVARWRPLDTRRHAVLHADVECRPCAVDRCPVGHLCALKVRAEDVLDAVQQQLAGGGAE